MAKAWNPTSGCGPLWFEAWECHALTCCRANEVLIWVGNGPEMRRDNSSVLNALIYIRIIHIIYLHIHIIIIYIFLVSGAEHLANNFQLWRLLQRSSLSLLYSWNTFLFWFGDWYDVIGYNMTWNDPIWFNLIRSDPIWYDPSIWSDMWFLFTSLSDLQSQERSSALGLGRLRLGRDRGGVGFATRTFKEMSLAAWL